MEKERLFLEWHAAHDYEALVERWRLLALESGMRMEVLAEFDERPVYILDNAHAPSRARGLYLCAGVHGDEPGATEGLIGWAERNPEFLAGYPVTILPCLNPWGLIHNCRVDGSGRDLNRMFDQGEVAPMRQWQGYLRGREFRLALCLHEDYDARGAYIYELARVCDQIGESLLGASDEVIPRHAGVEIEGRVASGGVVTPKRVIEEILKEIEGMPEAIYLFLHHTDVSLTYETPSEFSLYDRVRAQGRVLDAVVSLLAR